jgi:hypothetical protein
MFMRKRNISVLVDGLSHTVGVSIRKKQYTVSIDGQKYSTFTTGSNSDFSGHYEDFPIQVQGEDFILAVRSNKIRLVQEGKYIDNGEEFAPAAPAPKWVWIFAVLNAFLLSYLITGAMGGVIGGAIGGGFATGGVFICFALVRSAKSTTQKLINCILVTLGCWIGAACLYLFLVSVLSTLLD